MNADKQTHNTGAWSEKSLGRLRTAALIAVSAGAGVSLGLMLYAGRRNTHRLVMAGMAIWVLSPFIALAWANLVSKRWPVLIRATLYSLMLIVTLGTLAIYTEDALGTPRAKAAFVFVLVPPVSWLLAGIVMLTAALKSRRLN
jgi:hypothetical protein